MKVKRRDWEALQERISRLEADVREARAGTLMQVETGPLLVSVVVPYILKHLKVKAVHGAGYLLPEDEERRSLFT